MHREGNATAQGSEINEIVLEEQMSMDRENL